MRGLIDLWFELGRGTPPKRYRARTRDGWRLALYRFHEPKSHSTPVVLCHGMGSNRWNMDGPGQLSLARYLRNEGYDVWVVELRGAGRSTRPTWWNGKSYHWNFEDYVQHDAPAILKVVLRETGADKVHWVGHSMGGMIAYALLMSPVQAKLASAVTLGSPTMSKVSHPMLDFGVPYRSLLRYLPPRLPVGILAKAAAPFAALVVNQARAEVSDLGFHPDNIDSSLARKLMLTAVEDLPTSLLREFAHWYETKHMSDRYAMFDFTEHLERVTAPILIVAGAKDGLTPPGDLEYVFRCVGSRDKAFVVVGRDSGFAHDYSHADLILGKHAPQDIFPLISDWLEAHRRGGRRVTRRPVSRLRIVRQRARER
ncbi:MAG TPA: alpha/beta fold hydrolase [Terriglobales bacterium]|nr:alpha/beta fold hydrolase [Terriglobales bacterium]